MIHHVGIKRMKYVKNKEQNVKRQTQLYTIQWNICKSMLLNLVEVSRLPLPKKP